MRVLAHLSDLHFGRVDHALLEPLARRVRELRPHLVVVSGDLTQRARRAQFRAARRFLDALPSPQIVVPGNHDVPLYNLFMRFLRPLERFREFAAEHEPSYFDGEIAVMGVNTARSLAFKGGRIDPAQIERVRARLGSLDPGIAKVVVTHHPIKPLNGCGACIQLAGHLHLAHAVHSGSALIVQAGTATSTRGRGELNSFNSLYLSPGEVRIDRYAWDPLAGDFSMERSEAFAYAVDRWQPKQAAS